MSTSRQDLVGQTVTDANGDASVILGPVRPGTRWAIVRATVTATDWNTRGEVRLWRGSPGGSFIDGSGSPGGDVSEFAAGVELYPGESVYVAWVGCTAGTIVTVALSVDVSHRRGI